MWNPKILDSGMILLKKVKWHKTSKQLENNIIWKIPIKLDPDSRLQIKWNDHALENPKIPDPIMGPQK